MEVVPAADRELRAATTAAIYANRTALTAAILDDTYQEPFWDARFGARGRNSMLQDMQGNLDQLAGAVLLGIPNETIAHYRWLQQALVPRGICTQHLVDAVRIIERQLQRVLEDDQSALTSELLAAAREGLIYDHPLARAVAASKEAPEEGLLARLPDNDRSERQLRDVRYYLSYLTDAVVSERPQLFTRYTGWLAGELRKRGADVAALDADLAVLDTVLKERLPDWYDTLHLLIEDGLSATRNIT